MAEGWTYNDTTWLSSQFVGYHVEAIDGSIGKVSEASDEVGARYIVVDTGPWIFGKKVLLPAGLVDRVDHKDEKVYVNRTKDQIKDAPEFEDSAYREPGYRESIGDYYGRGGAGWQHPVL